MQTKLLILMTISAIFFSSCVPEMNDSKKLINMKNYFHPIDTPQNFSDPAKNIFMDKGAWFGFALPDSHNQSSGFVGPYLMQYKYGGWLSESLININPSIISKNSIKDNKSSDAFFDLGKLFLNKSYENGLQINQSLQYISAKSVLINISFSGNIDSKQEIHWFGDLLMDDVQFKRIKRGLQFELDNGMIIQICFSDPDIEFTFTEKGYYCKVNNALHNGNEFIFKQVVLSIFTKDDELDSEVEFVNSVLNSPTILQDSNEKRWTEYALSIKNIKKDTSKKVLEIEQSIAVKSLLTLINNWKSPYGELKNEGLFPSYARWYFRGFWAWDSWKHSVALAYFEPEVAKNQVRVMYDFQNNEGMIADCVFPDTTIENHNWRDTKPPLSAWAVWSIYKQTKDEDFLKEMYPEIVNYHEWWYKYRDHNGNGLCEYGSTDGTEIAARWESGMDNAVRFDDIKMIQNDENAWSMDQESVDLNSYLYAEKNFLKDIAKILGYKTDVEKLSIDALKLKNQIQELMFDPTDGYFYDIKLNDGAFVKVKGPEGWIPLWAGVTTQSQADAVVEKIMDPKIFNTKIPFPTLDSSNPKFNPEKGYWRGPVWMDQAYFALLGMNKYGYEKEAKQLTTKIFNEIQYPALYENYHPTNGTGLNSPHFSWTAAHLYLLYLEILNQS